MHYPIEEVVVSTIAELIEVVDAFELTDRNNKLYFRGENKDHGDSALVPGIYRSVVRLQQEHEVFREMQRFNDQEFTADKTAFDKISRMQHYQVPTRLLDVSEDVLSSLYFALADREHESQQSAVYLIEVKADQAKYYDSDAVSVVSNLVKAPLRSGATLFKSKADLLRDALLYRADIEVFNRADSASYLMHDIKEEKSYFSNKVDPEHLLSILFVKPKLTNNRLHGQKGAYFLFGLNQNDLNKAIPIIQGGESPRLNSSLQRSQLPMAKITKVLLGSEIRMKQLEKFGVTTPYIYPEMDKVSEYLVSRMDT